MIPKAIAEDFLGRFREIVSDPLNLLIARAPDAGTVSDSLVCLHNGIKVPQSGPNSYYGEFSSILVINRGVHEPLEEFVFQEVLKHLPHAPVMLELGAYWGHYSMWLKKKYPSANVTLVEPDPMNLRCGRENFRTNGLSGSFLQGFVGHGHFAIDDYLGNSRNPKLNILHADIQGYEVEMLEASSMSLEACCIDFIFLSTHSQELHKKCLAMLREKNYRIEVESDFEYGTTSYDGFILASNPSIAPIFKDFQPLTRNQINCASLEALHTYINELTLAQNIFNS